MTTNTKYITRMFSLTLLVCAAATSVFAMEENKADKLSAIMEKYKQYGKTFLLEPEWNTSCIKIESLEVNKQNLKRYAEQFLIANETLIRKLNKEGQCFKSFAVLTEAVSDIKENLDYTIPIIDFVKLAAFFDTGNIWGEVEDFGSGDFKSGAGVGMRVRTPIGPVNLDYGYPLNDEPGEDGRSGKFYFSVSRGF